MSDNITERTDDIIKEAATLNQQLNAATAFAEAPAPSLVFGEAPKAEAIDLSFDNKPEEVEKAVIDDSMLTEQEKKQVIDFAKQINLADTNSILQYGSGTQQKMAGFSDSALQNVKTHDLGEVGDMLSSVVIQLKEFDPNADEKGGFLSGVFGKPKKKMS